MEKAERVAVVPVSMGWSDLGSWDALHELSACGDHGNACKGDVVAIETENCLILPRGHSQEVKKLIEAMK
jgi:mannose-1-phosphate guanylyltransferase